MNVTKEIMVNKPINEVWEVLGDQYTQAYKWARGLYHSEGSGTPTIEGASCNNRTCETSFGTIKEEIKVFDTKNYVLTYEVIEGFPKFIKNGTNSWTLTSTSNTTTKVQMHFTEKQPAYLVLLWVR